jgi:hypothetical protein
VERQCNRERGYAVLSIFLHIISVSDASREGLFFARISLIHSSSGEMGVINIAMTVLIDV